MADYSPPSLSHEWFVGIVLLYVLLLAYLALVVQQLLLGIIPGIAIGFFYLMWRFLVAVEAIADALQRLAQQREKDR